MNQPPHSTRSVDAPSKLPFRIWLKKLAKVTLGGILASIGLELFLHPNQLIVGGVTGISAMFAYQTEMRLGLFLFLFNLPFILLSYRRVHRQFALVTVIGLAAFSLSALMLHSLPAILEHPLLAAVLGGLFLGLGIGLVLNNGGTLDSLSVNHINSNVKGTRKKFKLESIIMILNILVLTGAGIQFGAQQAMYSIIAYLIAFEAVHFAMRGYTFNRKVCIISKETDQLQSSIKARLRREPESSASHHDENDWNQIPILYYQIHVFETRQLKSIVRSVDPHASILLDVNEPNLVKI
ncbi:YitT family protein [Neobacillus mesonae]|nr:YitT family protein [Neobacillus mesonae]